MIAKIAVAAANFAIDKPYSYAIPQGMVLQPGMRVTVPFGRGNRPSEGIVLQLETADDAGLKLVSDCLDDAPLLSPTMLRLAAFMRERYFCTLYDAVRAILPAGLWFRNDDTYFLTEDRSWKDAAIRQKDAMKLLQELEALGGNAKEQQLRAALPQEEAFEKAVSYLLRKKWMASRRDYRRKTLDKTEKIATLASSAEEAMDFASSRPKSAAMQRAVLETMCAVGSVAVKELC